MGNSCSWCFKGNALRLWAYFGYTPEGYLFLDKIKNFIKLQNKTQIIAFDNYKFIEKNFEFIESESCC